MNKNLYSICGYVDEYSTQSYIYIYIYMPLSSLGWEIIASPRSHCILRSFRVIATEGHQGNITWTASKKCTVHRHKKPWRLAPHLYPCCLYLWKHTQSHSQDSREWPTTLVDQTLSTSSVVTVTICLPVALSAKNMLAVSIDLFLIFVHAPKLWYIHTHTHT